MTDKIKKIRSENEKIVERYFNTIHSGLSGEGSSSDILVALKERVHELYSDRGIKLAGLGDPNLGAVYASIKKKRKGSHKNNVCFLDGSTGKASKPKIYSQGEDTL